MTFLSALVDRVEEGYRRWHRLQPVGPLLLVGRGVHRGRPRRLDARTLLEPGDPVGTLHLDNRALRRARRGEERKAAFVFARLLLAALDELAEKVRDGSAFAELRAFHGITWIPRHGSHLGFVSEPLPSGLRTTLRSLHFRLLLRVFGEGVPDRLRPHAYWLSRTALLENFGSKRRR